MIYWYREIFVPSTHKQDKHKLQKKNSTCTKLKLHFLTFEACNIKLMRSRHLDFRGPYTDGVVVVSPSPTITRT